MEASFPDYQEALVLEPSHPRFSTLCCPAASKPIKTFRFTEDESARKNNLKRRRGCRCCTECGFWKYEHGFVRSRAKRGSPRFLLRMFRTCNHCSRHRKGLDEDEHFDQYGGLDFDP